MDQSILNSTKKMLGMEEEYTPFDLDVVVHINSALVTLHQLGVLETPVVIEDAQATWAILDLPADQLSLAKPYIWLKARILFDPPSTSFHIEAINNQIAEHIGRLSISREWNLDPVDPRTIVEEVVEVE